MRRIDRFDEYMAHANLNDNKVTQQLGLSVGTIGKSRKEGRDLSDRSHSVTMIYIKPDQSRVDEANRRVIDYVSGVL